jgi:hypothetical protein
MLDPSIPIRSMDSFAINGDLVTFDAPGTTNTFADRSTGLALWPGLSGTRPVYLMGSCATVAAQS